MTFEPDARIDPTHVEDRRGRGRIGGAGGPVIAGGGGIGILQLVMSLLLGVNPLEGLDPAGPDALAPVESTRTTAECRSGADANQRDDCRIVGFVDSVQTYWSGEFARRGTRYTPAKTVLYSGQVQAACGFASAAQGPFYCPADQRIYLDLSFFRDLHRIGAKGGPFAEAYVVAHEYGHHVQNVLGLLGARGSGPDGASVRVELMADCLAGVWAANAARGGILKAPTDAEIAQALDTAAAVGDDRIQRAGEGRVTPERWTHGSSEQRQNAFRTGMRAADMSGCDIR